MKKVFAAMPIAALCLCATSVNASAAQVSAAGPDNTGDFFGIVIAMLLLSSFGVAALVACKTHFPKK